MFHLWGPVGEGHEELHRFETKSNGAANPHLFREALGPSAAPAPAKIVFGSAGWIWNFRRVAFWSAQAARKCYCNLVRSILHTVVSLAGDTIWLLVFSMPLAVSTYVKSHYHLHCRHCRASMW